MYQSTLLNKIILISGLTLVTSWANSDSTSSETDTLLINIENSLNQGQTVIVYQMKNTAKSSEQYADWAEYLNVFSIANASTYKVYATNKALNTKLENKKVNTTDNYTLFLKKAKPSYYYDGVVVEAMVYLAVDSTYSDKPLSAMSQAFLPEVMEFKL